MRFRNQTVSNIPRYLFDFQSELILKITIIQITMAHIPYDLFVLFATAGGNALAVALATTCRGIKKKIDERFRVWKMVHLADIVDEKTGQRRIGAVGKFMNACTDRWFEFPNSIESLLIDNVAIISTCHAFPPGMRHLSIGTIRSQTQTLRLPNTLETFTLCENWNGSLYDFELPDTLQVLKIQSRKFRDYDELFFTDHSLPKKLKHLSLTMFDRAPVPWILPDSLESLSLGEIFDQPVDFFQLPPNLIELNMGLSFDQPVYHLKLPAGLKKLALGFSFNQSVDHLQLPDGLQILELGAEFNQSLDRLKLPASLKHFQVPCEFNQEINGLQLPPGLETIHFGNKFNQPIEHLVLPKNLKRLELSTHFNQRVRGLQLPEGLEELIFDTYFNQELSGWVLPPGLRLIHFGFGFSRSLEHLVIPRGVHIIQFECKRDVYESIFANTMLRNGFFPTISWMIRCERL